MKKLLSVALSALLAVSTVASLASCGGRNDNSASGNSKFKVGVILVGDDTEGYTKAHMDGIKEAAQTLGLKDSQILWKYKVEENADCTTAAEDLVNQGCNVIFSNSYGHQDYMYQAAKDNSKVTFVAMTGDYAAISGLSNFKNAFTNVYESRYVSGVVAGMKLQELDAAGKLTDENKSDGKVKIGYVGAYTYAEVVSGYTAFYLGVQSVYSNITMEVQFTDSWFDIDKEAAAAETLVNDGCVIIGQHADSTGAPSKCQQLLKSGKLCYSVGYNVDMLNVAADAALTSATNVWSVYYTEAIGAAMNGNEIQQDWSKGYADGAVAITALGSSVAEGTAAKVAEVEAALKAGTLKVFDTSKFTVNGETLTTAQVDLSYMDYTTATPTVVHKGQTVEAIVNGEFKESSFRAAPYFNVYIDGITWKNKTM